MIVIQSSYCNCFEITDIQKLILGSHVQWLYHMSTAYVLVLEQFVLTEMEGLQGIIHLSGKPYFGQGKVREFYA